MTAGRSQGRIRDRLLQALREYSEREWSAGWMDNLEALVWDRLAKAPRDDPALETIRALAWQANGWFQREDTRAPRFVGLNQWSRAYETAYGRPLPSVFPVERKPRRLRLDRILVVDLEATCWENEPPPGQATEIIEIGVCILHGRSGKIEAPDTIRVRPRRSTISEYCTRLTGLTQVDVDAGKPFGAAIKRLLGRHASLSRPWATWGANDPAMMEWQCDLEGVRYPFHEEHLNVKTLFALHHRVRRGVGLQAALGEVGLSFDGTPHRAGDDAFNAARLLAQIIGWDAHGPGGAPSEKEEIQ